VQSDGQWLTTKDGFEEEDHECQTTDDKVMSLVAQESRKSDIRVQYMDDFNTFNNRDADAPKFVTFKDVREDTMEFVEGNETGRFGNTNALNRTPEQANTVAATPGFNSFALGDSISYVCGICKIEFYLNNPED
jgi:hypothetical protein